MQGWEKRTRPAIRRQIKGGGEPRQEALWRNARCVAEAAAPRLLRYTTQQLLQNPMM